MPFAYADGAATACALIGGCAPVNPLPKFALFAVQLLVYVSAALAVLFVIWGGAQMLISLGDDSRVSAGKNSIVYALIGFGLALASQTITAFVIVQSAAGAADAGAGADPILATINVVINAMLYLFNMAFAIVAIVAAFRLVLARGKSEEFDAARKTLYYAIGGALIVNVSKSLVAAVFNLGL